MNFVLTIQLLVVSTSYICLLKAMLTLMKHIKVTGMLFVKCTKPHAPNDEGAVFHSLHMTLSQVMYI